MEGEKLAFKDLPDDVVRPFREYAIPTIEIDLDDDSSLDEIINLFVDINQQGERVKRFDIIKAIGQGNPLLQSVFELVAQKQTRQKDTFFKKKNNAFTRVLDRLQIVQKASDRNQRVDRMWERLVEIVLFVRTGSHRPPGQVLKAFIKSEQTDTDTGGMSAVELARVRRCFNFLDKAYSETSLGNSRLARDLPHFYTMTTTLLTSNLLDADGAPPDYPTVQNKLASFATLIEQPTADQSPEPEYAGALRAYRQAAARQTTNPGQRKTRQEKLVEILGQL